MHAHMREANHPIGVLTMAHRYLPFAIAVLGLLQGTSPVMAAELEEIVVTAQKREESAQDVPLAVSAFSRELLKQLGADKPEDIAAYVSGLTVSNIFGNHFPIFAIRGASMELFEDNQNNSVATYVDDVFVTAPAMVGNQMFDVEHIEVLKGPQGTLFGRNTSGGAVNIRSVKPSEKSEAYVTAGVGNFDRRTVEGAAGGALTDTINARISGKWVSDSGYQDNTFLGGTGPTGSDLATTEQSAARVLVSWTPSDALDVLFNVHGGTDNSKLPSPKHVNVIEPGVGGGCLAFDRGVSIETIREQSLCVDRFGNTEAEIDPNLTDVHKVPAETRVGVDSSGWGGSVTIDWDASDALTLTSITAYESLDLRRWEDWDGGAGVDGFNGIPEGGPGFGDDRGFDVIPKRNEPGITMFTQELRLTSNFDGPLNGILGLYYFGDEIDGRGESDGSSGTDADGNPVGVPGRTDVTTFIEERTSWAVFGQATYDLGDTLRLTLGARYTDDTVDFNGQTERWNSQLPLGSDLLLSYGCRFAGTTQPRPDEVWCSSDPQNRIPNANKFTDDNVSYRAALDWSPSEDVLLYGSLSTGYKSGGFTGSTGRDFNAYDSFGSEEITAYALGVKSEWLGNSLQLNAEIFSYDYDGLQVRVLFQEPNGDFFTKTFNVDGNDIKGLELDATWVPAENWFFRAGYSYLDATYGDVVQNGVPVRIADNVMGAAKTEFYKGREIVRSPKNSVNVLGRYEANLNAALGWSAQLDYSWKDDQRLVSNVFSDSAVSKAHGFLGARAALFDSNGRWDIAVWGKNLTDKEAITHMNLFSTNGMIYYAPPRSYGVEFTYYIF